MLNLLTICTCVLSDIKDSSAIMYKMLSPGPNLGNLVDGAYFCGQFGWLNITEHTLGSVKEETASFVSASCTLNHLSCEHRPLLPRRGAVDVLLPWKTRGVSKKSILYWG